jgi:arginine N-succinyltransferase
MFVIRPVRNDDLDQLVFLAGKAGFGLTSLPNDRDVLAKRVAQSTLSFRLTTDEPRGELYIFVMENTDDGTIVGTSCIVSKVGGFEPFYAYRVKTSHHESKALNIAKDISALHLVADHSGPCEIGGLFLAPEARKHGNGRLLSLFRFLFMAEHPRRFEPTIIAEMRGVVDDSGLSPFWEALGRHFFDMDFPKADYLSAKDKRFIADLMPTCPIYIPLLPKEAQHVIGLVHQSAEPALKMLRDEGFEFTGMVDIFEAGPVVSCRLDEIRIVKASSRAVVQEIAADAGRPADQIVITTGQSFTACLAAVEAAAGGVRLEHGTAQALGVAEGDEVVFSSARPSGREEG